MTNLEKRHNNHHISKTRGHLSRRISTQDLQLAARESLFAARNYKVQNFKIFNSFLKFSEKFRRNHTTSHISKTTRIWAVIFGGKICNHLEARFATLHTEAKLSFASLIKAIKIMGPLIPYGEKTCRNRSLKIEKNLIAKVIEVNYMKQKFCSINFILILPGKTKSPRQ